MFGLISENFAILFLVWFLFVLLSELSSALTESCSDKTLSRTASIFEGSGAKLNGLPAGFTELDAALFN